MKATVWTSRHATATKRRESKCIFVGDIASVPRVDEFLVLRDGFASEQVKTVTHDLVEHEVEISIYGTDPHNEYGPCLYVAKARE